MNVQADREATDASQKLDDEKGLNLSARPPKPTRRRRQEGVKAGGASFFPRFTKRPIARSFPTDSDDSVASPSDFYGRTFPPILDNDSRNTIEEARQEYSIPGLQQVSPGGASFNGAIDYYDDAAIAAQDRDIDEQRLARVTRLTDFFERFFQNTGTVATLGASITFALIVSQLQDPTQVSRKAYLDLSVVRILLASAWLLFTILLGLSFLLNGLVKYKWLQGDNQRHVTFEDYRFVIFLVYALMIGAFICLSLVVAAYVDAVGFLAVAVISILGVIVIVLAILGRDAPVIVAALQGENIGLTVHANPVLIPEDVTVGAQVGV